MKQQIAVYLRLSLEDMDKQSNSVKDESNSISAQRMLINNHLDQDQELRSFPRIEFCDDGFSGTNFERPGFSSMIEMVRHGEICCIVVKDLSRFGRDYLEVGDYLEHIFPFLGIRFKSVNDNYDSEKHKGKTIGMDIAFKNIIYDYYSKDLSKKVKSAMWQKQKECHYVSCVPYGYKSSPTDKHCLIIDPETADIVRRIFLEVISGKSCTAIAKELNMEGVSTPSEYKSVRRKGSRIIPLWTNHSVMGIIENIKYTGTMVNHTRESRYIRDKNQRRVPKEEWCIKQNAHQAIVTQAEYDAAQNAINRRRKAEKKSHDQSDRVYYCGHCGGKLEKVNETIFACSTHRFSDESPCEKVRQRKSRLEDVIFEALKSQIYITKAEACTRKKELAQTADSASIKMTLLTSQLSELKRRKLFIYEQYKDGKLTDPEYLNQKDKLNEREGSINTQINDCKALIEMAAAEGESRSDRLSLIGRFSEFSDDVLKDHLYDAIEKVIVYDSETIEILWKFNDIPDNVKSKIGAVN